jgi:hypothetical protein
MGEKLLKFYEFAGQNGGVTAQMRLTIRTLIPSDKAGGAPDSPDNIAKFKAAIREITGKDAPIS